MLLVMDEDGTLPEREFDDEIWNTSVDVELPGEIRSIMIGKNGERIEAQAIIDDQELITPENIATVPLTTRAVSLVVSRRLRQAILRDLGVPGVLSGLYGRHADALRLRGRRRDASATLRAAAETRGLVQEPSWPVKATRAGLDLA